MIDRQKTTDQRPAHHRRFVIVAAADPDQVIAVLDAFGWAAAIMAYAERVRANVDGRRILLREARPAEVAELSPAIGLAPAPDVNRLHEQPAVPA
jgi:hypothetical protein